MRYRVETVTIMGSKSILRGKETDEIIEGLTSRTKMRTGSLR